MRVIIFGCGGVGIETMRLLMAEGNEVVCFSDNSKAKWGTCREGKKVIPPPAILQEQFDYIAIGVFKAAESVRGQLRRMGISDDKIRVLIEPDRIFARKQGACNDLFMGLELADYTSENTLAYGRLDIRIVDRAFLMRLENLKKVLTVNNIPRGKVCVVGGAVLQAFGLRKSKEFDDIDIIMTDDLRKLYGTGLVIVSDTAEMHGKDQYAVLDEDIIRNSEHHFVYNDLKFAHPSILYEYGKKTENREYDLLEGYCGLGRKSGDCRNVISGQE